MDNLVVKKLTDEDIEMMRKKYTFEEDKDVTVTRLFYTLKSTRAFFYNLADMTYVKDESGEEYVKCRFEYENSPITAEIVNINVTADSCVALISDVLSGLRDYI